LNRNMNFLFIFIVMGMLNIWQLVQLIGFSKSFTGLLHFWDWYFWVEILILLHDAVFIIQKFLQNISHSKMNLVWKLYVWQYIEVLDFTLHFKGLFPYITIFKLKKSMFMFALGKIHMHKYICCIYVCIYMYIILNFMEKRNSKFKTNSIRWIKVC
jgi:hypothetical protein